MSKKIKPRMEYRYYDIPAGSPVLALLGEKWNQNYGRDIDYLHFHNHMEIGYCYTGEGVLTIKDEDFSYSNGMFSIIPKNVPHTTNSKEDTFSKWEYMFIDTDGFISDMHLKKSVKQNELIKRINQNCHFCKIEEMPQVAGLIKQIMETMRGRREFYMEEVKGLLTALLMEIARWNNESKEEDAYSGLMPGGGESTIRNALDYISMNYDKPFHVEDLAEKCHISETHFRRLFSEYMKMTPIEYINKVRVQMACNDLRTTNLPIGTIAVKNGFQNVSTFNRNFKRIMETSPMQWRKNLDVYERKAVTYDIKTNEGW